MWAPRDSCGLVETGGRPACLGGGTWIQLRSLEGAPSRRGGCEGLEQPRAWQSFQSRGLSEQGPACSGTVQAQDTVHFPVGGRGPLLATLMAEVSGTTLGPVPHAFPRLCHVARFLYSSWSLREEGRQDSLHGRRRPLTLLVAHVPDEETRVTRVR